MDSLYFVIHLSILPLFKNKKQGDAMEQQAQQTETIKKAKLFVLMVEDNKVQQKILMHQLEQLSYQVEIAENAGMAIEFVKNKPYTLIFVDLGLPDRPGETVIQEIRKSTLNQSTPIIVCTAHASAEKEQQCLDLGANKILIKPVQLKILEQAIKDVFKQLKKPSF